MDSGEEVPGGLSGVPLMLGTGTGAEIRRPLGYAIIGGLIVSQALTLYATPIVFLYLDHLNASFTGAPRVEGAPIARTSRIGKSHRLPRATWRFEVPKGAP